MKRAPGLLLALLVACLLAGCGTGGANDRFTPQNDIITYTQIDPDKTQLLVSSIGNNIYLTPLSSRFEELNPDVQVIYLDLTGGTTEYKPVVDCVVHGSAPDLMFVNANTFADDAQVTQYFEDLSANPVVDNFETAALERISVGERVYFLPAPSEINCMMYNKTLFERYGWSLPTTFDEFVALCVQIREDTDGAVQPWNPNAKYGGVFSIALEAFTYEELFGGAGNRGWYNDFCKGEATFAGHMEPLYDMLQTLIDNGILLEEHFNYSATTRGKEFQNGQIAMYNAPVSRFKSDEYEFDFMPYPTTHGQLGYVNDSISSVLCVPKKEHTDAERDAMNRYIAFFASVEGQQKIIRDGLMVSNVKDVPLSQSGAMSGIEAVIAQGHKFSLLDFPGSADGNWAFREKALERTRGGRLEASWTFRGDALSMVKGERTGAEIIAAIDAQPYNIVDSAGTDAENRLAEISEDMSMLEFSFYIADTYREKASADIGLINHGVAYRGNLVRLFKGDMLEGYVSALKPRSFANQSTLVKLSMTGRQLMDALNHPMGYETVSNSVYAYSGLECEVAPWNELGKKYVSVRLAGGAALEPDKLYTVAAWDGTIAAEYITETLESYKGSWEELMTAKFRADGAIAPAKDGRIRLIWK